MSQGGVKCALQLKMKVYHNNYYQKTKRIHKSRGQLVKTNKNVFLIEAIKSV